MSYATEIDGTMHSLCTHCALTMHSLCTHCALTMHSLCTHYALTIHSPYTHYPLTIHSPHTHSTGASAELFRYLNFDQLPQYVEIADTVSISSEATATASSMGN
jgi:hypothetical protein